MADWQVDFDVVPRGTFPLDYAKRLNGVAAPEASSTAELQTWGTPDGNRIDVWSVDGRVTEVKAHVDVRRLDSKFGAALIQFVRTANAVLVRRDGLVVEPTIAAYAASLRTSDAWKFANEPAKHLFADSEDEADDS